MAELLAADVGRLTEERDAARSDLLVDGTASAREYIRELEMAVDETRALKVLSIRMV
ncbi:hypothetical protein [Xanthomonas campestris]|uniref:hypothetical protein n=1 Tax=Xanthomonas campestris TaxID=339 RepID=UPI001F2B1529|nr:hypothetical protein [Xanthomonas campestris]